MDSFSTNNSFQSEKSFKSLKMKRNNSLGNFSKLPKFSKYSPNKSRSCSFTKKLSNLSLIFSERQSDNFLKKSNLSCNCVKKPNRKDRYGNIIQKNGKQKVSFKDNFKGQYLVEMTLIDVKQSSLRGKNYKNYTISREARDKEELLCSGVCNIF